MNMYLSGFSPEYIQTKTAVFTGDLEFGYAFWINFHSHEEGYIWSCLFHMIGTVRNVT